MNSERRLIRRVVRFGIVGAAVTSAHFLIALTLIHGAGVPSGPANGWAFLCATAISYAVNALWSFETRLAVSGLAKFLTISAVGFSISWAIGHMAEAANFSPIFGVLLVALAVPPITFAGHFLWTFAENV